MQNAQIIRNDKIKLTNAWAKYKFGMTAETYNEARKADRAPREGTRDGRRYDENRAVKYMSTLTGKIIVGAKWSKDETRVQFVKTRTGDLIEIPNWDFAPEIVEETECEMQGAFA